MGKIKRYYTARERELIISYYRKHGLGAMLEYYKGRFPDLAESTVYGWMKKLGDEANAYHDGDGMAHTFHRRATATVPKPRLKPNGALVLLERWQRAQLAHIRDGHAPNTYDAYATLALLALQESEE